MTQSHCTQFIETLPWWIVLNMILHRRGVLTLLSDSTNRNNTKICMYWFCSLNFFSNLKSYIEWEIMNKSRCLLLINSFRNMRRLPKVHVCGCFEIPLMLEHVKESVYTIRVFVRILLILHVPDLRVVMKEKSKLINSKFLCITDRFYITFFYRMMAESRKKNSILKQHMHN